MFLNNHYAELLRFKKNVSINSHLFWDFAPVIILLLWTGPARLRPALLARLPAQLPAAAVADCPHHHPALPLRLAHLPPLCHCTRHQDVRRGARRDCAAAGRLHLAVPLPTGHHPRHRVLRQHQQWRGGGGGGGQETAAQLDALHAVRTGTHVAVSAWRCSW